MRVNPNILLAALAGVTLNLGYSGAAQADLAPYTTVSYRLLGDSLTTLINPQGLVSCRRAFKSDQLCALNFDQGR
jgi:hypothetical protein